MTSTGDLFIGLVGRVGADFDTVIESLKKEFSIQNYEIKEIKLSALVDEFFPKQEFTVELDRINHYMDRATEIRKKTSKNFLSNLAIAKIIEYRESAEQKKPKPILYIFKSLKRPEEVDNLRAVYKKRFILISIHSPISTVDKNISKILDGSSSKPSQGEVDQLKDKDFNEQNEDSGQSVLKAFPKADIFINTAENIDRSIKRFVDILFSHPFHTPTKDERCMYIAKGVSLRSSDPSRQVGAIIVNDNGDILATGCNDVPKFGGGLYEPSDKNDDRDFIFDECDINLKYKMEIIGEILSIFNVADSTNVQLHYDNLIKNNAKITNLLEFGRMVHAEMEAISDAARRGIMIKGSTLYSTTYPCHLCVKLILAVGVKKVIYIDPYPKSEAKNLFRNTVKDVMSPLDSQKSDILLLEAFMGISPRIYHKVFLQNDRKQAKSLKLKEAKRTDTIPFLKEENELSKNFYILAELFKMAELYEILESSKDIKAKFVSSKLYETIDQANLEYLKLMDFLSQFLPKKDV